MFLLCINRKNEISRILDEIIPEKKKRLRAVSLKVLQEKYMSQLSEFIV